MIEIKLTIRENPREPGQPRRVELEFDWNEKDETDLEKRFKNIVSSHLKEVLPDLAHRATEQTFPDAVTMVVEEHNRN